MTTSFSLWATAAGFGLSGAPNDELAIEQKRIATTYHSVRCIFSVNIMRNADKRLFSCFEYNQTENNRSSIIAACLLDLKYYNIHVSKHKSLKWKKKEKAIDKTTTEILIGLSNFRFNRAVGCRRGLNWSHSRHGHWLYIYVYIYKYTVGN